jgi:apolipoprotein N-acyltransferase
MKKVPVILAALTAAFVLLMSLPWLVPHLGWTALLGLVPLLVMERLATEYKLKHFWWAHYGTFVLWNAVTTWWVGGATVGGAVFAILANSLQMSVVFGSFRWVKRRTKGAFPYIFLAAAWIAWERYYLTVAQISWPWLVLGNAFADTTGLVQWYSVLGTLGGSLWVWTSNLGIFGLMVALSDGRMGRWTPQARIAAFAGVAAAFFGPMIWSACLKEKPSEGSLKVVIGQPNYDPYEKFESLTRQEQDRRFLGLLEKADWSENRPTLVLAPETFTLNVFTDQVLGHETFVRFQQFLKKHPQATFLYGASTMERVYSRTRPHPCAYDMEEGPDGRHLWVLMHNSAILTDTSALYQIFHKSKLVVGTELTPYPGFFIPLEKFLNHGNYLMAKDIGQPHISCLTMGDIPVGTAICYESVYGEYCTGYVREGAQLLTVITNDAWWGNTPGYRQHFNYSRLRAIETRRWVARCGNTGVSALIDPEGHVVKRTAWWEPALLEGTVGLSTEQTFFCPLWGYGGPRSRLPLLASGCGCGIPRPKTA